MLVDLWAGARKERGAFPLRGCHGSRDDSCPPPRALRPTLKETPLLQATVHGFDANSA